MKWLTVILLFSIILFIAGCSSQVKKSNAVNKIIENKTNESFAQQENTPAPSTLPSDEGIVDINSAMGVVQGSPDDIIDNTTLN